MPLSPSRLTATDADGADLIDFDIASGPASGSLDPVGAAVCPPGTPGTCSAEVVYHPTTDTYGVDSFSYIAIGVDGPSAPATVSIAVNPINDPPSFIPGADPVTVSEDSDAYSATWATDIDPGLNEDSQAVAFLVDSTNAELFDAVPAITPDGTLRFTPKAHWSGTSTVTVLARDNGGVAVPGDEDTSAPVMFDIQVTAVNDARRRRTHPRRCHGASRG